MSVDLEDPDELAYPLLDVASVEWEVFVWLGHQHTGQWWSYRTDFAVSEAVVACPSPHIAVTPSPRPPTCGVDRLGVPPKPRSERQLSDAPIRFGGTTSGLRLIWGEK